jgi:outer membrane lipoprotein SlyB
MIAIVQEAGEEFHPGDRARIVENGETSRVTH